jgi:choline dehydrogenase-like flavoprotein
MLYDVDTPEGRAAFARPFDVCVIGTGPAGTTLARRLAAQGLQVALMEAGGLEWSEESQAVAEGESVGLTFPDLEIARLRYLGGSSGHWNGLCRPLDAADFESRPGNPDAGWPIARADLDPFTAEVHDILDLVPIDVEPGPGQDADEAAEGFRRLQYFRSAPTRFGEKYLDELTSAPGIALGLHANLVDLRLDEALTTVTGAVFRGYAPEDPGFTVSARAYALCCGGIENARLLLNFTSQVPAGIGNQNDVVGRYFNDHPGTPPPLGEVILATVPTAEAQFFTPTGASVAALETLPMMVRVNYALRKPLSFGKEAARSLQCAVPFADRLTETVLGDKLLCDTGGLGDWWQSRDQEANPWGRVVFNSQAALNRDSRVMLADETDAFGMRRVKLDWRTSPVDDHTIRETVLAFAAWLADNDLGRMRIYDWVLTDTPIEIASASGESMSSWHHMCSTRMSTDPEKGVVDGDCRVHGVSNLFIGGSSVFASTGFSNPTYTIVQLALRLGDHLGGLLATPAAAAETPAPAETPAETPAEAPAEAPAAPAAPAPTNP